MVKSNLAFENLSDAASDESNENNTLNWCSISLSEVVARGMRFEATVYDVEGRKARNAIIHAKCGTKTITGEHGISTAYTCARFKRNWVEYSNFPIYQPSSILNLHPQPDGYIAANTATNIEALRVQKGQVLVTCSGTIGKTTLVSDTLNGKIFSHDLLRITCKDESDAGYLYAFIKSDVGNKVLTTNQYGAVVSHIEASHLNEVPIPYPTDTTRHKISDLICESFRLRDSANMHWEKAMDLLYDNLHLIPFTDFKNNSIGDIVNTFSVKLSALSNRVDASFHNKLATEIEAKLRSEARDVLELGDKRLCNKIFLPGRFKRVYVSKGQGTKMFGIKQITTLDPFTDKYLALGCISKQLQKELLLEPGSILVSRSGTIGNICIVPPHWKHWIASEDLIRIEAQNGLEGYIFCFLSSEYGQALIQRFSFGSVQDHIDCEQVAQIPIPRLNDENAEKEINHLVEECNRLRGFAYQKEQEALRVMNDEVIYVK